MSAGISTEGDSWSREEILALLQLIAMIVIPLNDCAWRFAIRRRKHSTYPFFNFIMACYFPLLFMFEGLTYFTMIRLPSSDLTQEAADRPTSRKLESRPCPFRRQYFDQSTQGTEL